MEKRVFDIIFSSIAILILWPVGLIIGLLIYLNDFKPIFFRQIRVGKNKVPFTLYKFRTMTVSHSASKGTFDPGDTSRITSIGRILRKSKLDELPQLYNVLIGDMSFVGPRPEVSKWVNRFPSEWGIVLRVKPGITDNASILFRNEEEILHQSSNPEITYQEVILPQKLQLYIQYVQAHTFWGDLKILVKTISAILKN